MINRSILAGTIFSWLGVFALAPAILVLIGNNQKITTSPLEEFLLSNQAILTSVGTILLIAAFGVLTTEIANRSAEKRDVAMRTVQSQLKIAEFRQSWINSTLDEVTNFSRLIASHNRSSRDELVWLMARISIRLNHEDALSRNLIEAMNKCVKSTENSDIDRRDAVLEFISASHFLLNDEWRRLKSELRSAIGSEDATP